MLNGVKEEEFQGFRCYVYHRGVERRQLQQVQDLLPGGEVTSDEGLDEIIEIKNEVVRREEGCLVEPVKTHTGPSAWMRLRTLLGVRIASTPPSLVAGSGSDPSAPSRDGTLMKLIYADVLAQLQY